LQKGINTTFSDHLKKIAYDPSVGQSLFIASLVVPDVVCFLMTVAWIWATKISNAGIVDVFWAFNFAVIAILVAARADSGNPIRKMMVCGLALLWSLRLGIHLQVRVFCPFLPFFPGAGTKQCDFVDPVFYNGTQQISRHFDGRIYRRVSLAAVYCR
jgi:hypothetical protein